MATEVCILASVDTEPVDVRMEDRDSGQGKNSHGHTKSRAVNALLTRGQNKSWRQSKSVKSAATVDSDDGTVATSSAQTDDRLPAPKGFHAAPDGAGCLRCTNSSRPCLVKKGRACWSCHHAKTGCTLSNWGCSCSRAPPCCRRPASPDPPEAPLHTTPWASQRRQEPSKGPTPGPSMAATPKALRAPKKSKLDDPFSISVRNLTRPC